MLNLPQNTEMKKQLPKSLVYTKFRMNNAAQQKFDADISKMFIVNELSERSVNIAAGENVSSIYIINVQLKSKDYDEKNIILLSKLIPQKIVFILECVDVSRLAVFHTKLMQSEWQENNSLSLSLSGITLDKVWYNFITQIGNFLFKSGNTLDEQIAVDEKRQKLKKEIDRLEKQARAEKQPKKKFELVHEVNLLTKKLERLE